MTPIEALRIVDRVVNEHRLDAMDQNPRGFRDLLGSAIFQIQREHDRASAVLAAAEELLAAEEAMAAFLLVSDLERDLNPKLTEEHSRRSLRRLEATRLLRLAIASAKQMEG